MQIAQLLLYVEYWQAARKNMSEKDVFTRTGMSTIIMNSLHLN